jgi:hypothetical protein
MNMKLRLRVSVALAALLMPLVVLAGSAAAAGETVTCPSTVQVNHTLTCTTNVDPAGRKITYTNPRTRSTINVANASAITATNNGDGTWTLKYTPYAGEIGRVEILQVPYNCVRLGCSNTAYAAFTVTV